MCELSDKQLNAAIGRLLGWKAYREKRGQYALCVTQAPEEREPWKGYQNGDARRSGYTECSLEEAQQIGYYGRGLPAFTTNAAQCFALVEKFNLHIIPGIRTPKGRAPWIVEQVNTLVGTDKDLRRAICLAVAKMQLSKEGR